DFFERNRTGVLVSRMTADIDSMQDLIGQGLSQFIVNGVLFFGSVLVMTQMSWELAMATLVTVPLLIKGTLWFRRESNKAYLDVRDSVSGTLTSFQEGLAGVRVVQAYSQEPALVNRFHQVNEGQFKANLKTEKLAAV